MTRKITLRGAGLTVLLLLATAWLFVQADRVSAAAPQYRVNQSTTIPLDREVWVHPRSTCTECGPKWREKVRYLALLILGTNSHPCFDGGRKVWVQDVNPHRMHTGQIGWVWAHRVGACDHE